MIGNHEMICEITEDYSYSFQNLVVLKVGTLELED